MALLSRISSAFRDFASAVLDMERNGLPRHQSVLLNDLASRHNFSVKTADFSKALSVVKKKHLVDSVIVSKKDGTVIVSTHGNGLKESITATALFNYVSAELPESEVTLIKQKDDWLMVLPFEEKVFIVKAGSDISSIELKALAREIERLIKKQLEPGTAPSSQQNGA